VRDAAWVEAEYALDTLGPKRPLTLPLGSLPPQRAAAAAGAGAAVPAELRARVAQLLASQSSRRMYVTVQARRALLCRGRAAALSPRTCDAAAPSLHTSVCTACGRCCALRGAQPCTMPRHRRQMRRRGAS